MKVGAIITYSEKARKTFRLKKPNRLGRYVRDSRKNKNCIMVQWEGVRSLESLHRDFIISFSDYCLKEINQ